MPEQPTPIDTVPSNDTTPPTTGETPPAGAQTSGVQEATTTAEPSSDVANTAETSSPSGIEWETITAFTVEWSERIIGATLVLIVGLIATKWIGAAIRNRLERYERLDAQAKVLAVKLTRSLIMLITVVAVLSKFGIQTAGIIALLGGLGLAIGLALQGSLSNVASGVMIMIIRPFTIGSVIKTGSDVFIIDAIGLFVTRAHQPEGPKVTIPNNSLWGTQIINLSTMHDDLRRIDYTFGIGYSDDINQAITTIETFLAQDDRYLTDPEQLVAVTDLGDSSVNVLCRVWTKPSDWWPARLDLIKGIKEAFDQQGISIPFPQRDVHIIQSDTAT